MDNAVEIDDAARQMGCHQARQDRDLTCGQSPAQFFAASLLFDFPIFAFSDFIFICALRQIKSPSAPHFLFQWVENHSGLKLYEIDTFNS